MYGDKVLKQARPQFSTQHMKERRHKKKERYQQNPNIAEEYEEVRRKRREQMQQGGAVKDMIAENKKIATNWRVDGREKFLKQHENQMRFFSILHNKKQIDLTEKSLRQLSYHMKRYQHVSQVENREREQIVGKKNYFCRKWLGIMWVGAVCNKINSIYRHKLHVHKENIMMALLVKGIFTSLRHRLMTRKGPDIRDRVFYDVRVTLSIAVYAIHRKQLKQAIQQTIPQLAKLAFSYNLKEKMQRMADKCIYLIDQINLARTKFRMFFHRQKAHKVVLSTMWQDAIKNMFQELCKKASDREKAKLKWAVKVMNDETSKLEAQKLFISMVMKDTYRSFLEKTRHQKELKLKLKQLKDLNPDIRRGLELEEKVIKQNLQFFTIPSQEQLERYMDIVQTQTYVAPVEEEPISPTKNQNNFDNRRISLFRSTNMLSSITKRRSTQLGRMSPDASPTRSPVRQGSILKKMN